MNKISIIWVFMLILSLFLVNANTVVRQEANAGLILTGGQGFVGHASNIYNPIPNSSYDKCSITSGEYQPIAGNLTEPESMDLVVTENDKTISIYDFYCNVNYQITYTDRSIKAMPVLVNDFNDNGLREIIVATNYSIDAWEYNSTNNNFWRVFNASVRGSFLDSATSKWSWGSCASENPLQYCIFFRESARGLLIINFTDIENPSFRQNNALPTNPGIGLSSKNWMNGVAFTPTIGNTQKQLIPFCWGEDGLDMTCQYFNLTGNKTSNTFDLQTGSGSSTSQVFHLSSFIAKHGTIRRMFVTTRYAVGVSDFSAAQIFDLNGNELFDYDSTRAANKNKTSNWVVGDFTKTGDNLACLIVNDSFDGRSFKCWDSGFNLVQDIDLDRENRTQVNISGSLVMADFLLESSFLGIGTREGIFIMNESGLDFYLLKHSGSITDESIDEESSAVTVVNRLPGSPSLVWISDTTGFILSNTGIYSTCGDGICQESENAFTCKIDCDVFNLTQQCFTDSDCPTNFPNCLSGYCVSGLNTSFTCSQNTDCPVSNPVCFNGFCIKGVSGGNPGEEADVKTAIDNALDVAITGNPRNKKLIGFLGLFGIFFGVLMAFIGFMFTTGKGNPIGAVLAAYTTAIIYSFVAAAFEYLDWFVPILLILVIIILLILFQYFTNKG